MLRSSRANFAMTVTIELPPEIELSLTAMAEEQDLGVAQYVIQVLLQQLSPAERAVAWREACRDLPDTPSVSDEAISRENIYRERG